MGLESREEHRIKFLARSETKSFISGSVKIGLLKTGGVKRFWIYEIHIPARFFQLPLSHLVKNFYPL